MDNEGRLVSDENGLKASVSWTLLTLLVLAAIGLRLPGIAWLIGVGPTPDFSFTTDDQRFVDLARNFAVGMPDGYVHGMTSQLLALRAILSPFITEPNLLQLLRLITIAYAALTIVLIYATARSWSLTRNYSLLAVFFLATAPLHVATSNFGTADVTAVFYFYATLACEAKYLQTRQTKWFIFSAALTGVTISVKLFLPLLVPLALLILVHTSSTLLLRGLLAGVVALISFAAASLFAYGYSDFITLTSVLRSDVVAIPGSNNVIRQLLLYLWDAVSALNVLVALLTAVGAAYYAARNIRSLRTLWQHISQSRDWRASITPTSLMISGLAAHAFLIVTAGAHAVRHELVFVPIACIGAAYGLMAILERRPSTSWLKRACTLTLLIYGISNAVAVEGLFNQDVRAEVANWVRHPSNSEKFFLTFSEWSRIKGVTLVKDALPSSLDHRTQIVTCDLEFNGYLRSRDASTYATAGGQKRTDFFWDIFEGRSTFRVVKIFAQRPLSLEQALVDNQLLRPFGTYIPKTCLIFGQGTPEAGFEFSDVLPKIYYTAGW